MSLKQSMDLSGRVALITGGSRGLGLQMAEGLGEMGARVVITARKAGELEEAQAHLVRLGVDCVAIPNDQSDPASVTGLVDQVLASRGQVDILVNNAGCSWSAPAETHPDEGWNKVMRLNVDAQFFLAREVGRRSMIPRRSGRIINISSMLGFGGNPPHWETQTVAYNASKGALITLTKALAAEWGRYGITVNAICPGFFHSKMSNGLLARIDEQVIEMTPLGRLGNDEDLKGLTAFLASDASAYVTGQAIAVDGGFTAI